MTRPMVIGHRGWPGRYPDNTLVGLLAAAAIADGIEIDVRRSGDGKLVLSHDPWIDGLVVSATPLSILGEVDLGAGNRPCLLDEAMAALPGTPLQLEIKNLAGEPGFEPDHRLALEAAERARPGDMVTSFNWETLAAVRRLYPEVATGVLVGGPSEVDVAVDLCLDVGHRALLPWVGLPTNLIGRAVGSGVEVFPWVVNEPVRARELAELGVTGIISDHPDLMVRELQGR